MIVVPTLRGWRLASAALLLALALAPLVAGAAPLVQVRRRLLTDPIPDPHQPAVLWFAATGHSLRGAFLDYWTRFGGLAQFGYPLTEEFVEPAGPANAPLQVQYFERNRFEQHPENAGTPYEVLLGTLGRTFHAADPPAPPLPAPTRYFATTGHNLSGAFLNYWDTHGTLFVHGYPLTEPFQEVSPSDGKSYTVQYFERSRFEYHPENAGTPYEVLLGLLGTRLAQQQGYPYGWYPQDGHAADFSWVAGALLPRRECFESVCLCPLFAYSNDGGGSHPLYVVGPGWHEAEVLGKAHVGAPMAVFGHLAGADEQDPICRPTYIVDQVQANPAQ